MSSERGDSMPVLDRYRHLISVLLIIIIIGGGAAFALGRPAPVHFTIVPPEPTGTLAPTATAAPSATPGPVQVYVTGAVARPQTLVRVPSGSRVSAVIDAAGGLTETADLDRVNLAQIVRDGDQIHIHAIEETSVVLATPNDDGIVYINVAGIDELVELPRIGPAMAARIIEYREANGPFTSLEDVDAVSGIGPSTLEELGPHVSFEIR